MKTNRISTLVLGISLALGATSLAAAETTVSQDVQNARREAQIWTTYAVNPHLKAFDLSVEVRGSQAVLTGTVDDGVEKDLAEQIALGVKGVEKVDNRITVDENWQPKTRPVAADGTHERAFGTVIEDASITAAVKSKLLWNSNTDGLEIDVDTMNGKVSLTGTADTAAAKDLAGRLARNTDGVHSVANNLKVDGGYKRPARDAGEVVSDAWITTRVKSTLVNSRWVDAIDIDVDTKDGVVSLKGEVDSSSERDLAIELAKNVRGVKRVDASGLKQS
jgi:hyperosmotically inducible periplasmic protein